MQSLLLFTLKWKLLLRVFEKKSEVCFPDISSVIAQGPVPGPGSSDEKLDFDDDTLKGEKNNCHLVYYLIHH